MIEAFIGTMTLIGMATSAFIFCYCAAKGWKAATKPKQRTY